MKPTKKNREMAKASPSNGFLNSEQIFLFSLSIFVLLLFSPIAKHQFINYDDPFYLVQNPLIKDLSLDGLRKIFTVPVLGMYNPLPFLLYAIEYALWGLQPKNFFAINLLLHLMASVACYFFIMKLCNNRTTAIIVTLLFAIHPMHVSVVAWVSQSKTSMYALFYFIGLIKYMDYEQKPIPKNYLLTLFWLLLSLFSKPSAVSFIGILFLLDYYQGRPITLKSVMEKFPFFALCFGMGLVNLFTHHQSNDTIFSISENYSLFEYILIGNYGLAFYFEKLLLPFNLSILYPYPKPSEAFPMVYYFSLLLIPSLVFLLIKIKRYRKEFVFGLAFFLCTIALMLRIIPAGDFGMGNQYSYLSYTGLFFVIARFITLWYEGAIPNLYKYKSYAIYPAAFCFIFFSIRTIARIKKWENSLTLFTDVMRKYPENETAYKHRSLAKAEMGDFKGAIMDLDELLKINPEYSDAYLNRGEFYATLNQFDEAISNYRRCLAINPKDASALVNLGQVYLMTHQLDSALVYLNLCIEVDPSIPEAYFNRGLGKYEQGKFKEALPDFKKAKELGIEESTKFIVNIEAYHN